MGNTTTTTTVVVRCAKTDAPLIGKEITDRYEAWDYAIRLRNIIADKGLPYYVSYQRV